MGSTRKRLVLASASTARGAMLRAAGVEFTVQPADIDEGLIKAAARAAGDSAPACAMRLAEAKALRISGADPQALVIGADQLLAAEGDWFDKPVDLAGARCQLRLLRGRTHMLATAACVAHHGAIVWRGTQSPRLTMRNFGEAFLTAYIAAESEALLGSVGAYRVEGRGVQLFERIEGDYFAVLGLPLLDLFDFLRSRGMLPQ